MIASGFYGSPNLKTGWTRVTDGGGQMPCVKSFTRSLYSAVFEASPFCSAVRNLSGQIWFRNSVLLDALNAP